MALIIFGLCCGITIIGLAWGLALTVREAMDGDPEARSTLAFLGFIAFLLVFLGSAIWEFG